MQGHKSTIRILQDSINFDGGSTSSNVGIDQQIFCGNLHDHAESRLTNYASSSDTADTCMPAAVEEGKNLNRWLVGGTSSSTQQNLVNHDEQFTQNGLSSATGASSSVAPRLEAQCFQPTRSVPRNIINLNLDGNHQNVNTPFTQFHRSGPSSQIYDLNVHPVGQVGGDHMECVNSAKAGGVANKLMPSGSNPSDPFYSAVSGHYLVEEDDPRPGLDGRRLSCKRKAFEGNAGQSSNSGSSLRRGISIWPDVSPCHNVGSNMNVSTAFEGSLGLSPPASVSPRLGLGVGGLNHGNHAPNASVGVESPQRNYRMRINPSMQQNSSPDNSYLSVGSGHSNASSVRRPSRVLPVSPPLDLVSSISPDNTAASSQSVVSHMALQQDMQALSWNPSSSSRPASSSAAFGSRETDAPLNNNLGLSRMTRSISEHPMFPSAIEDRYSTYNPAHWGSSGANVTFPRNVNSSSRSGQGSGSHSSARPNWVAHRHSQSQYSRRVTEYIRRSLLSSIGSEVVAQGHNILARRSASSQEIPPSGSGSQVHNHSYPHSALRIGRLHDGVVGAPYSLRALGTVGEGRTRFVSEIRNVLDMIRRGEGLRFEDIMILDQTALIGMADMHDQHRDMRLDVDNMSYEELLALEERIGNVCTGLNEETVLSRMKQRKYLPLTREEQAEMEPCCICQENYNDGEQLGTLDCGHDFHTDCIKQWLAQKNVCPICKTTAVGT